MSFTIRASNSHRRRIGGSYNDLILASGPIAYWPQNEASGAVAHCLVDPTQNGTFVGATLANDNTGPFNMPAPYYDGANDYCGIGTAAFLAAFNSAAGSAMIWGKVANAGVWTDAATRLSLRVGRQAADDYIFQGRTAVNNTYRWRRRAAGNDDIVDKAAITDTAWFQTIMTWDESAGVNGETVAYWNGIQEGLTQTLLGTWGGIPVALYTCIGSFDTTPQFAWHGWLGPCSMWDRVLPPAEARSFYLP